MHGVSDRLNLSLPQPQGVGDHVDGAHGHHRHSDHRMQQPDSRQRNGQAVVEPGPEVVLLDLPEGSPRELHCGNYGA